VTNRKNTPDRKTPVMQKRTEVLSVKASPVEKDMIIRASAKYGMPYSEFVRIMAISACRSAGIEEADDVTSDDVRRRRPAMVTQSAITPEAETAPAVA
jgi:hypothetical protein